jgi:hypothetical protein
MPIFGGKSVDLAGREFRAFSTKGVPQEEGDPPSSARTIPEKQAVPDQVV